MSTNDEGTSEPARAGFEHLETAAHEMIAAARSMLDAVEELLDDPRTAASITAAVTTVGRVIEGAVASVTKTMAGGTQDQDDEPHVQRIRVS
jgi:hypothetical protein